MKNIADQKPESPKKRRSIPLWLIILCLIVTTLAVAGVGRHYFLSWKERRLVRAAHFYLETGDAKMMRAAIEKVLQLNPNNVEAFRISGQALLKEGNTKAIPWLRRAVELAPESVEDPLALADASLRFGQTQDALKVIRDTEGRAKGRADYQDLAGRVNQNMGLLAAAKPHFEEAVRLAPENPSYRLHLAVINLSSDDAAVREKARHDAEELSVGTPMRAAALRGLIVDSVRSMHTSSALAQAAELDALPDHLFSDSLMHLEVLHLVQSPEFQTRLTDVEQEASQDKEKVLPLLYWMNGNNLSMLAKDWALHLPPDFVSTVPVRLEIARSYAAFGDWKRLRFFLADERWGDFDYMRRAFLARCYRELESSDVNSKATWVEAINAAAVNGESLLVLARQAVQWGWDTEAADALWQAVSKSNRSGEALNALCQLYFSKRNTAGLYRAYALLVDRNPTNASARNNFAVFCLLLDKEKEHAMSVAQELHQADPKNPIYASTYAFALFRLKKTSEALKVMQALKPEELREPSVAAYYSAILVAAGQTDQAQEYRQLARGASLLPEEEKILNLVQEVEAKPAPVTPFVNVQPAPLPPASVKETPAQPVSTPAAPVTPVQSTPIP